MSIRQNRNYQKEVVTEILNNLDRKKIKKVGAFINCGLGKTFIGSDLASAYLKKNKRVVISAYALKEIKETWLNKILDFKLIKATDLQVIVPASDISKYQSKYKDVLFTTEKHLSKERKVIITIPQSVKKIKFLVDLFIVDEIHEYYDVGSGNKVGRLKKIIKSCSHKNTKIVGLTGTGFDMVQKGDFSNNNNDVAYVVRDLIFALDQKAILPVKIKMEYFDFQLENSCYKKSGDLSSKGANSVYKKLRLNKFGKEIIRSKISKVLQLDAILSEVVKSKKTLIIVPRGKNLIQSIRSYVDRYMVKNYKLENCVLIKASNQKSYINDEAEREFRNNPKVKFMIVVDMCGTGWDYEKLDNVIDLTFTKNQKLVIQRMSRPCRYSPNKKPVYYFCTDQTKEFYTVPLFFMQCINLMTENGILNPVEAKRKVLYPKKIVNKVFGLNGNSGSIDLGDIRQYFVNNDPKISNRDQEVIDMEAFVETFKKGYSWHHYIMEKFVNKPKSLLPKLYALVPEFKKLSKKVPQESDLFMNIVKSKVDKLV